ncbi:hypothetical protein CCGE525_20855 [Rhizobium jaguaris]|uniref:Uncharacterized protein n=1 Tax=Rhizobium jaguaris TaxID=1312183 RepID=A0A387FRD4_9HYPH|nr:hypothetical protein CCGE525_20855 [Rhizobium jaguaris]
MSRKSAQRFCDNDMRKIKGLKRKERIPEIAMRFRGADKLILIFIARASILKADDDFAATSSSHHNAASIKYSLLHNVDIQHISLVIS